MPQSLARILIHLVFSTAQRRPLLHQPVRGELHAYLAAVLRDNGCLVVQIGGVEDHVHLLFGLSRTLSLAQVVEMLKTSSCKWLKIRDPALAHFRWQAGYGAFSVSQPSVAGLVSYIRGQEDHHRTHSFREELLAILQRSRVPYDERYLWD